MKQTVVLGVLAGSAAVAFADAKPIDLAAELRAIAAKSPPPKEQPITPVAGAGCTALTTAERADAKKRALAWIDSQFPDEEGPKSTSRDAIDLFINVGCKDAAGTVVLDVSQDRDLKKKTPGGFTERRRNYVLRVTAAAIDEIAGDQSTSTMAWSEWADEGRISLLGQLDVDGDGALDIVYSDHEHEGGSTHAYDRIHVRFATGKTGEAGQVTDLGDVKLAGKQLAIAGTTREGAMFYACLGADLHLSPCAAAKPFQAAADRRAILDRFGQAADGDLPDREQLASDLAKLGTRAQRRATLVAAAQQTDPGTHVQREVTAFLVKAGLIEPAPMPDIITQTHAEARTYLDDVATKLGDTPCAKLPLTAEDNARATAWVKKQDAKADMIIIDASACGPYTWVAWNPPSASDGKRREVLLGRDGTTRVLGFTYEFDMPGGDILAHLESWFVHDGKLVGVIIGSQSLWVLADGKPVAQTKGDKLGFYRYDDRFGETSSDLFLDGGTIWHATPTGRERPDPAILRDHEARRAAIALVSQGPATADAKYIAALELLGADKALIAECKKL